MAGIFIANLIKLENTEENGDQTKDKLTSPLIPGPKLDNNPFDEVANDAENWNPFDIVLKESLSQTGRKTHTFQAGDNNLSCYANKLTRSQSVTESTYLAGASNTLLSCESHILGLSTYSLDEDILVQEELRRKFAKEAVSEKSGRVLNKSRNESCADISLKCDVLPNSKIKVTSNYFDFNKENSQDYSIEKVGNDFLEISKESLKLSELIRNLSFSSTYKDLKEEERVMKTSEYEDLFSISPPWELEAEGALFDNVENEHHGLPKVNLYYAKKKNSNIDYEQLALYKKRIRASFDGNMSDGNLDYLSELNIEQSSEQSAEPGPECKNKESCTVFDASELRLKHKSEGFRNGPLKAMVPLQEMTRNLVRKISPRKKGSHSFNILKKNKDSKVKPSISSIVCPVSSSTPKEKKRVGSQETFKMDCTTTPVCAKSNSFRSRQGERVMDRTNTSKRSSSLSAVSRIKTPKQPFSPVNEIRRPRSAPSPKGKTSPSVKASPADKKEYLISKIKKNSLALKDKENRIFSC